MKWEYHVTANEEDLSRLGEEEWELVAILPKKDQFVFYLKKPKPTLTERITEEQRASVYRQLNSEEQR